MKHSIDSMVYTLYDPWLVFNDSELENLSEGVG